MAIQRTQSELQTLLHDNSTQDITPAIMRDMARSIVNNGIGYLYSFSTTATAGAITWDGVDTITMNKVDLNTNDNSGQLDVLLAVNNIITLIDTANNARLDGIITDVSFASSVYTITITASVNDGSMATSDFILAQIASATGTTDHAALSHLDYASAGHTGFASSATTISAGTGLSGGGDLSTNRTISLSTPVSVSNGGTGDSSLTAYSVLTGGTTSTGPVQSVSGVGMSGQVLTSNGASSLPTWQNASASAGGSNTQLQFNDSGSINGTSYLVWDKVNKVMTFSDKDGNPAFSTDTSNNIFVGNNGSSLHLVNGGAATLSFFGASAVGQQNCNHSIGDGTGGTPDTTMYGVSGTGDDTNINNNFATITAELNMIRTLLHNYGLGV